MPLFEAGIGGSLGNRFRVRFNLDVIAQEEDNNRSLVNYSAYVDNVSYSGNPVFNNGNQANSTTNKNGSAQYRGTFNYSSGSPGRVYTAASNEQFWVGHDGNGNGSVYGRYDVNLANSPYVTTGAVETAMGLPALYQGIGITNMYSPSQNDVSFTIVVNTNRNANLLQLSINDGAWTTYYDGGYGTGVQVTVGSRSAPLLGGTTYSVRARVRRGSNGVIADSGYIFVTTSPSNNFFDTLSF